MAATDEALFRRELSVPGICPAPPTQRRLPPKAARICQGIVPLQTTRRKRNRVRNCPSSYYNSTSSAINVHQRSTDSIAPSGKSWVNSAGCQLVGKKSEYLSFIKAVGIVSGNSVTTYSSRVSGRIVIDRTYATTYLLNVGYPSNAISAIRG